MAAHRVRSTIFALLLLLLAAALPGLSQAQTPSPLQDWQYSSGWDIARLYGTKEPDWIVITGGAVMRGPLSTGSDYYRTRVGPVIDVRYRDEIFLSMGEGLGVNLVKGPHGAAGVAISYDNGRKYEQESGRLRGLADIPPSPVVRAFADYVVSRAFPLVLQSDVRKFIGGAEGVVANAGAYLPLPGSSASTFLFAGPGVTWADHDHMSRAFGISQADALSSGYAVYAPHAGVSSVGFGFSGTHIIDRHWIISLDAAVSRMSGDSRDSPLTQQKVQHIISISSAYAW